MKILVTGGAGFIGSHIVDRYITLNHEVVIIDDFSTGRKDFINPKAIFYQVNIRNRDQIAQILQKEKPEILNHHAAQMDVRKSVAEPQFDAEVNIIGLLNLLEEGKNNGLKKVIFASSGGAVYGDTEVIPTPESHPTHPASPYGVSKICCEYYLGFYKQTYGIEYIALRYGNVYGPRQNPHGEAGVVAIFTQKMLKGEQPIINGDGEQARDFVYVGDIVDANVAALQYSKSISVNIGTGRSTTVNTLFDRVGVLSKTTFSKNHGPAKPGEQKISVLDSDLATQVLGWKPSVSLDEGLQKTIDFFIHEK